MNIYEVAELERQLEVIAEQNQGEIPEEKLQELVEAETKSVVQIDKLCRYIRHLELYGNACKDELNRISKLMEKADRRVNSIKKYLTPFVDKRGKMTAGIFTLSVIKSQSVELNENFVTRDYSDIKIEYAPDKKSIKQALKDGEEIKGARLVDKQNLQLK